MFLEIHTEVLTELATRLAPPAKHPASEMGSAPAWTAAETHPTAVGPTAIAHSIKGFWSKNVTALDTVYVKLTRGITTGTSVVFDTGGGGRSRSSENSEDGDNRELHFEK